MKKRIRLTESGLKRLIKKYLNEALSNEDPEEFYDEGPEPPEEYDYVLFEEPLEHYVVIYVGVSVGNWLKSVSFAVDAHDQDTALKKVVAFCQNNGLTSFLISKKDGAKMIADRHEFKTMGVSNYYKKYYPDDYNSGNYEDESYYDNDEFCPLMYVDPRREGGKEPCYLEVRNIKFV